MNALQPTEVMSTLEASGLRLSLTPDLGLLVTPAACLNDTLRGVIRQFKPLLVEHLQRLAANDGPEYQDATTLSEADRELIEERAAIMQYDGGLTQVDAERLAAAHTHYLLHHWGCETCCTAGQGRGQRCPNGAALWDTYNQSVT
jgi:hypothetical protein